MTDEKGNFSFRGLISGGYTIHIDKEEEFESFAQTFDVIQLRGSPPQVYTLNIRLKSKAGTDAKPGVINAGFANVPKKAMSFYTKGLELSKAGDHKGAIEHLILATTEYPSFMLAHNELGVEYLRINDLENAEASYQRALKIDPEAFIPTMNRGIVLFQMKRYAEAEAVLQKAVARNAALPAGHYFLGQSLANLGRFEEAEKELLLSIKLGGETMKEAYRILAIIYGSRGEKKKAASQLETYLKLAPRATDADQLRKVIAQLKAEN